MSEIPRLSDFPLKVAHVYFCNDLSFSTPSSATFEMVCFEVSLRLRSDALICEDLIDGVKISMPFPHVVFKRPGTKCILAGDLPRDTIAFSYDASVYQLLKKWKLVPDENFLPVSFTGILPELIERFRMLCLEPKIGDICERLDWVCFQILRELVFARENQVSPISDTKNRIRRAAIYLQQNCRRSITMERAANYFGFSRAVFFREWKKVFPFSPKDHILRSRLEMAALRLIQSNLPVADIAEEVNFSGKTAFYRKFQTHFGVSPGDFRHNPELWHNLAPNIKLVEQKQEMGRPKRNNKLKKTSRL